MLSHDSTPAWAIARSVSRTGAPTGEAHVGAPLIVRQQRIMRLVEDASRITWIECARTTGASLRTASRNLRQLVEHEDLISDGRAGKAAGYRLAHGDRPEPPDAKAPWTPLNPDPAMGAIWGGVLRDQRRVDGEGARKRKVSSFGGHGSAAMRRPEANRR